MRRVLQILRPILANIGPLVAFLLAKAFFGLIVAIIVTIAVTLGELVWRLAKHERPSRFFWFTVVITLLFGGVDVWLNKTVFFRYEAVATNVLSAIWFAATTLGERPIILEFAERGRRFDRSPRIDIVFFFRLLTWVWVTYFIIKAVVYLLLALQNQDLSELVLLRALIGSTSFYVLLGLSIFGGRRLYIWIRDHGWMPSQRAAAAVVEVSPVAPSPVPAGGEPLDPEP